MLHTKIFLTVIKKLYHKGSVYYYDSSF